MVIWVCIEIVGIGLFAGILSGVFGIGGGIVIVPMLVLMGQSLLNANAISLLAMLLPVSIFGVVAYYKAGYINRRTAAWLSIGLFIGSFVGATIAVDISNLLLKILYISYLIYVSIVYLDIVRWIQGRKKIAEDDKIEKQFKSIFPYIGVGFLSGIIAGMFGKGGGMLIVFFLTQIFHYKHKTATAISLAAMLMPIGLPGIIIYVRHGYLNYPYYWYSIMIASGILVGTFVGSKIALKLDSQFFKKIYAIFLICVIIYLITEFF